MCLFKLNLNDRKNKVILVENLSIIDQKILVIEATKAFFIHPPLSNDAAGSIKPNAQSFTIKSSKKAKLPRNGLSDDQGG